MTNSRKSRKRKVVNTELVLSNTNCASATPESRQANKRVRSKSKPVSYLHLTSNSPSLPMLALASISGERDLSPYWNKQCAALQSTLWCATEIDSPAAGSTSSNLSCGPAADKSLRFIKQRVATSSDRNNLSHSSPRFAIPTTVEDRPATKFVSRKIRIYPQNKEQWVECLHASRRAYNLTIAELRGYDEAEDKQAWKDNTPSKHQPSFRKAVRDSVSSEFTDVPRVMLDEAVDAAYDSRSNVISRRKQGEECELSFRSRKSTKQSFVVQRLASGGVFPTTLKAHYMEALPSSAAGRMACVVYENGRWFLTCQCEVAVAQVESQDLKIVALDPGVRTFLTTYSFDSCEKIGDGFYTSVFPLLVQLDRLISWRTKLRRVKNKKQCHYDRLRSLDKQINNLRNRLRDRVDDLHHRAADFLTREYDVILLPTFETQEMSNKVKRKIGTQTVQAMLGLGHYRFKCYLKWIAYKRGKHVVDVNEAYTSKTDSRTGEIVDVGPSRTINRMCRDLNGARGILLKHLAA